MTPRLKPLPHLDLQPRADTALRAPVFSSDALTADMSNAHDVAARCTNMAESVTRAAKAMNELIERNKEIRAEAEVAIDAIRGEAQQHRERANQIEAQLDAVNLERQRIMEEGERRIRALSEETGVLKDRLEKAATELINSEQWLEYLNTRIKSQLDDVFARTEAFWASRRVEPSA